MRPAGADHRVEETLRAHLASSVAQIYTAAHACSASAKFSVTNPGFHFFVADRTARVDRLSQVRFDRAHETHGAEHHRQRRTQAHL